MKEGYSWLATSTALRQGAGAGTAPPSNSFHSSYPSSSITTAPPSSTRAAVPPPTTTTTTTSKNTSNAPLSSSREPTSFSSSTHASSSSSGVRGMGCGGGGDFPIDLFSSFPTNPEDYEAHTQRITTYLTQTLRLSRDSVAAVSAGGSDFDDHYRRSVDDLLAVYNHEANVKLRASVVDVDHPKGFVVESNGCNDEANAHARHAKEDKTISTNGRKGSVDSLPDKRGGEEEAATRRHQAGGTNGEEEDAKGKAITHHCGFHQYDNRITNSLFAEKNRNAAHVASAIVTNKSLLVPGGGGNSLDRAGKQQQQISSQHRLRQEARSIIEPAPAARNNLLAKSSQHQPVSSCSTSSLSLSTVESKRDKNHQLTSSSSLYRPHHPFVPSCSSPPLSTPTTTERGALHARTMGVGIMTTATGGSSSSSRGGDGVREGNAANGKAATVTKAAATSDASYFPSSSNKRTPIGALSPQLSTYASCHTKATATTTTAGSPASHMRNANHHRHHDVYHDNRPHQKCDIKEEGEGDRLPLSFLPPPSASASSSCGVSSASNSHSQPSSSTSTTSSSTHRLSGHLHVTEEVEDGDEPSRISGGGVSLCSTSSSTATTRKVSASSSSLNSSMKRGRDQPQRAEQHGQQQRSALSHHPFPHDRWLEQQKEGFKVCAAEKKEEVMEEERNKEGNAAGGATSANVFNANKDGKYEDEETSSPPRRKSRIVFENKLSSSSKQPIYGTGAALRIGTANANSVISTKEGPCSTFTKTAVVKRDDSVKMRASDIFGVPPPLAAAVVGGSQAQSPSFSFSHSHSYVFSPLSTSASAYASASPPTNTQATTSPPPSDQPQQKQPPSSLWSFSTITTSMPPALVRGYEKEDGGKVRNSIHHDGGITGTNLCPTAVSSPLSEYQQRHQQGHQQQHFSNSIYSLLESTIQPSFDLARESDRSTMHHASGGGGGGSRGTTSTNRGTVYYAGEDDEDYDDDEGDGVKESNADDANMSSTTVTNATTKVNVPTSAGPLVGEDLNNNNNNNGLTHPLAQQLAALRSSLSPFLSLPQKEEKQRLSELEFSAEKRSSNKYHYGSHYNYRADAHHNDNDNGFGENQSSGNKEAKESHVHQNQQQQRLHDAVDECYESPSAAALLSTHDGNNNNGGGSSIRSAHKKGGGDYYCASLTPSHFATPQYTNPSVGSTACDPLSPAGWSSDGHHHNSYLDRRLNHQDDDDLSGSEGRFVRRGKGGGGGAETDDVNTSFNSAALAPDTRVGVRTNRGMNRGGGGVDGEEGDYFAGSPIFGDRGRNLFGGAVGRHGGGGEGGEGSTTKGSSSTSSGFGGKGGGCVSSSVFATPPLFRGFQFK